MTVMSLIPLIGAVLGALPAVIVAALGGTWIDNPVIAVVVVVILFVAITEVGSKVIYPLLVGVALGLHPVVTLFVLLAGFEVGGVVGGLLAAPLTAIGFVTAIHLDRFCRELPDHPLTDDRRKERHPTRAAWVPRLWHRLGFR